MREANLDARERELEAREQRLRTLEQRIRAQRSQLTSTPKVGRNEARALSRLDESPHLMPVMNGSEVNLSHGRFPSWFVAMMRLWW